MCTDSEYLSLFFCAQYFHMFQFMIFTLLLTWAGRYMYGVSTVQRRAPNSKKREGYSRVKTLQQCLFQGLDPCPDDAESTLQVIYHQIMELDQDVKDTKLIGASSDLSPCPRDLWGVRKKPTKERLWVQSYD